MAISQSVVPQAEQVETGFQPVADPAQEFANYRRLVERVGGVFGDATKASLWLSSPSSDLDGETPLQVAGKDGYSSQSLEPVLMRIEHGIYY